MVVDDCDETVDVTYREPVDGEGAREGEPGDETENVDGMASEETAGEGRRMRRRQARRRRATTRHSRGYRSRTRRTRRRSRIRSSTTRSRSWSRTPSNTRSRRRGSDRRVQTDESIEVSIRDNCPPIPVEERYVITDRWEMDDLRHTGGMGLWLVYWVANRSGGDLTFDTHADGNVVTLSVPNAKCGTINEDPRGDDPVKPPDDRRSRGGRHAHSDRRIHHLGTETARRDGLNGRVRRRGRRDANANRDTETERDTGIDRRSTDRPEAVEYGTEIRIDSSVHKRARVDPIGCSLITRV